MVLRDPPLPKKKRKEEEEEEEGHAPAPTAKASAKRKNKSKRGRTSTGPAGNLSKRTPASQRVNKSMIAEAARGVLRAVDAAKSKVTTKSIKDLSQDELLNLYNTGTVEQKKIALAILMDRIPESGATSEEVPTRRSADGAGTSTGVFTKPHPTPESRRKKREAASKKVDEMQDGTGECVCCCYYWGSRFHVVNFLVLFPLI